VTSHPDHGSVASEAHLRLAGFALAHALASIDGGGTLCTLAFVDRGGERELLRYEADSVADSVAMARTDLRARLGVDGRGALVYDGYLTLDRVRHDALLVDLVAPDGQVVANLVQPYRPGRFGPAGLLRAVGVPLPGGLRVIGPPISESSLPADASTALASGLAEHPYGRKAYGIQRDETTARAM
jgi:hypothetical protein